MSEYFYFDNFLSPPLSRAENIPWEESKTEKWIVWHSPRVYNSIIKTSLKFLKWRKSEREVKVVSFVLSWEGTLAKLLIWDNGYQGICQLGTQLALLLFLLERLFLYSQRPSHYRLIGQIQATKLEIGKIINSVLHSCYYLDKSSDKCNELTAQNCTISDYLKKSQVL